MEYRNPPIYLLAADYTALGAHPQQDALIRASGWQVVNAPRPLPRVGKRDGVWVEGTEWEQPGVDSQTGWFYAASDPAALEVGTPLAARWNALDATPVVLIDDAELLRLVERELEYPLASVLPHYGGNLVALARDLGIRVATGIRGGNR